MAEYFHAEVISRRQLTPSMLRLELGGGDMGRFRSSGKPDEWVRLLLPSAAGEAVDFPACIDGKWQKPPGPTRPYTVRGWDAVRARLTLDFVAHDSGLAWDWATRVRPGERLGLSGAEGRFCPPQDAEWILLFADMTGLPAVARILEEMEAGPSVTAHLEIPGQGDRQPLPSRADTTLNWHHSYGAEGCPSRLLDIARSVPLPPGPGYIWIAGEVTAVAESRKHFRDHLGVDKDRITAVGYWIIGQSRG